MYSAITKHRSHTEKRKSRWHYTVLQISAIGVIVVYSKVTYFYVSQFGKDNCSYYWVMSPE